MAIKYHLQNCVQSRTTFDNKYKKINKQLITILDRKEENLIYFYYHLILKEFQKLHIESIYSCSETIGELFMR